MPIKPAIKGARLQQLRRSWKASPCSVTSPPAGRVSGAVAEKMKKLEAKVESLQKELEGKTTLEEVLRVTREE